MRNHIAHGYLDIDADIVYEAVIHDIPELKATINTAILDLEEHSANKTESK